jgi:hypothetical protein
MSAVLCNGSGLLGYPEGLAIGAVGTSVTASSGNFLGCMVDLLVAWWISEFVFRISASWFEGRVASQQ